MDGITHTIIATGLMFASYYAGNFFGRRKGEMYVWDIIGNIFNAAKIEITENGELIITDMNGNEKKVK
jgi:hypothetical protein|tara:strand:- start:1076 stop:1279 length:204 start_codon:yes stop_codon:yes gene_type:complete